MNATRRARLAAVIREELSIAIQRELKDPRVPSITITGVQVSEDAGQATIQVAVLGGGQGDESESRKRGNECIQGLNSAAGFLRRLIAPSLNLRHVPALHFKEDRGFENVARVHELLRQIADSESKKGPQS